jgi:Uri superfamily endonuclease
MDRETILRELAKIEDRVARTQGQIASYREHISRLEDSGRDPEWAKLMLRQCEEVMALHLSMHARLIERLSRSTK